MRLKNGITQRIEMYESRRRLLMARLRNRDVGIQAEIDLYTEGSKKPMAHSLMIIVVSLLDDYLEQEAKALAELIWNSIADDEYEEDRPTDVSDLPW